MSCAAATLDSRANPGSHPGSFYQFNLSRVYSFKIEAEQARRRLELDSGLNHRPLASLDDALAIGINDTQSQELWRAHQSRMSAQSEHLKLKLPKAQLSRCDPLGLRAAVLILLIGFIAAGADSFSRVGQALSAA